MDSFFSIISRFLETTSDYCVIHQNGIVIYANNATLNRLQINQLEMIGRHYRVFVPPDYQEISDKVVNDALKGNPSEYKYFKFYSKSKELIYVECQMFIVEPPQVDAPWVVFFGKDVTQLFKYVKAIIALLPDREQETVKYLLEEFQTKTISAQMEVKESTISTYKRRIKDRLETEDLGPFLEIVRELKNENSN